MIVAAGSDDATEEGSISVVPVIGAAVEGPGVGSRWWTRGGGVNSRF